MKSFSYYRNKTKETGFVEKVLQGIVYATGLPGARSTEVVVFETGEIGQILSLGENLVEILLLSEDGTKPGIEVARTGEYLKVPVGEKLLGKIIDPLGNVFSTFHKVPGVTQLALVDIPASGISSRKVIDERLETGVTLVDFIAPLAKGQRELVIGDRKTGKTTFVLQTILTQARKGVVCIYGAIGKKAVDIKKADNFFKKNKVGDKVIIVASDREDPAGLIYTTPFTAMTVAEYFRDQGRDVLVVLDDMITHAKFYREITLLARRFPGRNSYPGDIFYTHARIIERAGKFQKGSISCFPVAETVQGDLTDYIQTNLMAMTDGHLYFDHDLFDEGRRPAVNTFLSVTRVGLQAQSTVLREASRELTKFLVHLERMRDFIHFGAELNENIKEVIARGEKLYHFFEEVFDSFDSELTINIKLYILVKLWAGFWDKTEPGEMGVQMGKMIESYKKSKETKAKVDKLVEGAVNFSGLVTSVKTEGVL